MGDVVDITMRLRPVRERRADAASPSAEIVLFTGVRYERHGPDAGDRPEPPRGEANPPGRRRKRRKAS